MDVVVTAKDLLEEVDVEPMLEKGKEIALTTKSPMLYSNSKQQ